MARAQQFGTTWWGGAWIGALEGTASLEPARLAKGRRYARDGSVGPLEIGPGYVSARVMGQHGRYYRTDITVRALARVEWEQVADAIAAKAGHAAALLDGELDPGIVDDIASCDIRLLPGPGDLRPDCTCPDWAEPCKHAAAVCYLVANELDRDPFTLFLLRRLGRDDLMSMVRVRRSGTAIESADFSTEALGVDAAEAWEGQTIGDPLEPLPDRVAALIADVPSQPLPPPAWGTDLPRGIGPPRGVIDALAVDAVERAWAMLADGSPSGLRSGFGEDLARRASTMTQPERRQLAHTLGWPPHKLDARVEAWGIGGEMGVLMLEDDDMWSTDQVELSAGRDSLVDLGYSRRQVSLNYDSLRMRANVWLALGPDGRWYRMQERGQRRELHLTRPPSDDICDLVDPPPST